MRGIVIFFAIISYVASRPDNGYYHQEYNYKTSSSSFENNELQRHNQNEGFYSKDGDLDGRIKPLVNSHSQHADYVNPRLLNGGNYAANSYSDRLFANSLNGGYASSDRISDLSSRYSSAGGAAHTFTPSYNQHYTNNFGNTFERLVQNLQNEMNRQVQTAVSSQFHDSGVSVTRTQMTADVRSLEDELRKNLTRQIEDNLRYQQRVEPAFTYDNREIAEMKRRLEQNLVRKLHNDVEHTYGVSSATTMNYPRYTSAATTMNYPRYTSAATAIRTSESLTTLASRAQNEINANLDECLNEIYRKYLQNENYRTLDEFNAETQRIRDEIRRNVTYNLDESVRRTYGEQFRRTDEYGGANYDAADYARLKTQIEENLIRKLQQTVDSYREQFRARNTITITPRSYTSSYNDIQARMSQELQAALRTSSGYSHSRSSNYQDSYNELARELRRNLTEQLTASNMQQMRAELERQLMQQLQQGLQKQYRYSASASYSASSAASSGSNYNARQSYGNHESWAECCTPINRKKREVYPEFSIEMMGDPQITISDHSELSSDEIRQLEEQDRKAEQRSIGPQQLMSYYLNYLNNYKNPGGRTTTQAVNSNKDFSDFHRWLDAYFSMNPNGFEQSGTQSSTRNSDSRRSSEIAGNSETQQSQSLIGDSLEKRQSSVTCPTLSNSRNYNPTPKPEIERTQHRSSEFITQQSQSSIEVSSQELHGFITFPTPKLELSRTQPSQSSSGDSTLEFSGKQHADLDRLNQHRITGFTTQKSQSLIGVSSQEFYGSNTFPSLGSSRNHGSSDIAQKLETPQIPKFEQIPQQETLEFSRNQQRDHSLPSLEYSGNHHLGINQMSTFQSEEEAHGSIISGGASQKLDEFLEGNNNEQEPVQELEIEHPKFTHFPATKQSEGEDLIEQKLEIVSTEKSRGEDQQVVLDFERKNTEQSPEGIPKPPKTGNIIKDRIRQLEEKFQRETEQLTDQKMSGDIEQQQLDNEPISSLQLEQVPQKISREETDQILDQKPLENSEENVQIQTSKHANLELEQQLEIEQKPGLELDIDVPNIESTRTFGANREPLEYFHSFPTNENSEFLRHYQSLQSSQRKPVQSTFKFPGIDELREQNSFYTSKFKGHRLELIPNNRGIYSVKGTLRNFQPYTRRNSHQSSSSYSSSYFDD